MIYERKCEWVFFSEYSVELMLLCTRRSKRNKDTLNDN